MAATETLTGQPDIWSHALHLLVQNFGRAPEVDVDIEPRHISFLSQRTIDAGALQPGSPAHSALLATIEGAPKLTPHLALFGARLGPEGWKITHYFVRSIDNLAVKTIGLLADDVLIYGVRSTLPGIRTIRFSGAAGTVESDLRNGAAILLVDPTAYRPGAGVVSFLDSTGNEVTRQNVSLDLG